MADDRSPARRTSRRAFLSMVGGATVLSGCSALDSSEPTPSSTPSSTSEPTPSPVPSTSEPTVSTPETGGYDAENIVAYGAQPNPTDPSLASAIRNDDAIRAAAAAAGEGGAIYVPPGTFFFGQEEEVANLSFGEADPAGISIYGAGPGRSTLALSRHIGIDESHVMVKYRDTDHGQVEISNLRIDGNYEALPDLVAAGRASRAFELEGDGQFNFSNVHFRGIYSTALRLRALEANITHCTFEEVGIGSRNDGGSGHAIETYVPLGKTVRVENCAFERIGSFAFNWRFNDGVMIIRDCYVNGAGTGIIKLSAGQRLEIHNCYFQPNTPWIEANLRYPESEEPFHGRHFINRLFERARVTPSVVLQDVEVRNCTHDAMLLRAPIELSGDNIAIHNTNLTNEPAAIRDYSWDGGGIQNMDVRRLSVHNSRGDIFELGNSSGTIGTLSHSGNRGIGPLDDVSIEIDLPDGQPYQPNVVDRNDAGMSPRLFVSCQNSC